jgi:DNA polymerase-3 subunit gamma/tau
MAHLALYRTFRPSTLEDVVRQEHIVTVLKNQIESGKIGHAYLFCGPRGTGKTSIAKIFAQAINCESPIGGSPCGKCSVCKALSRPENLDINEIDAASNNGVDEMRDLREKVQYPPVAGKYKVYIVDEVHMLSMQAFNALLKTLEEPPHHAVFILATTESHKIPPTILSRCMRFDFKLIPQSDLENRLRYVFDSIGKKYDDEAISAIARAGAGSVRDMLSIADTCAAYTTGKLTYKDVTSVLGSADFDGICRLCDAVLQGRTGEALEVAEGFLSAGKSVGMLIGDVLQFLNECSIAKSCRGAKELLALPQPDYEQLAAVAKQAAPHSLLRATEIFAKAESELKYSTLPRVIFEAALFKASMPQTDTDVESLLARIEQLENKLLSGVPVAVKAEQVAPMSALNEEKPMVGSVKKPSLSPMETVEDDPFGAPPIYDEPPIFEEPMPAEKLTAKPKPKATPVQPEKPTQPKPMVAQAPSGDAKATFGLFLRSLRKTGRNGVLFTICMDLDASYEAGVLVLSTESETMYNSMKKEEHYAMIAQAFANIGIGADGFALRLKTKQADTFSQSMNELKETFPSTEIEVK